MNPIILLDVDGVLNTLAVPGLHKDKINLIKDIIDQCQCNVVVTSARRDSPDFMERLRQELGIDLDSTLPCKDWERRIHGKLYREQEIAEYLMARQHHTNFVIIDDYQMGDPYLSARAVCVNPHTGMTVADKKLAIGILTDCRLAV